MTSFLHAKSTVENHHNFFLNLWSKYEQQSKYSVTLRKKKQVVVYVHLPKKAIPEFASFIIRATAYSRGRIIIVILDIV